MNLDEKTAQVTLSLADDVHLETGDGIEYLIFDFWQRSILVPLRKPSRSRCPVTEPGALCQTQDRPSADRIHVAAYHAGSGRDPVDGRDEEG